MAGAKEVERRAEQIGVFVASYSPGDGVRRYRFDDEREDYFAMRGLYTALGAKEALTWLAGYGAGQGVK